MKEYKLSDIAEVQTGPFGSQLHNEDYVTVGTPIVTVEHLGNRRFSKQNLPLVSDNDKKRLTKYFLQVGDIVFSRVGSVDRCSYVTSDENGWLFSGRCLRVRCYNNCYPLFLYYYFCNESIKQYIKSIAVGATMPSINTKLMADIPVLLPNINQQKCIADILSSLDDKIEQNRRINENLEQQAQALFKSWFVDFEPFKDGKFVDSELGMIPEGWDVKNLGELCDSISVTHPCKKGQLIFLNTGDIENGFVLTHNYMNIKDMPGQAKKSIQENDILYSEIRPINRHFAFVNFPAQEYIVSTKLMVIRAVDKKSAIRLYQYLTSDDVINELQHEAESRSGTFPQIRFDNIKKLKILIGPDDIENQYTEFIGNIYKMIFQYRKEIIKLEGLRDTLLPKLMSGELKINDFNN